MVSGTRKIISPTKIMIVGAQKNIAGNKIMIAGLQIMSLFNELCQNINFVTQ
jgi:hypothetical protein